MSRGATMSVDPAIEESEELRGWFVIVSLSLVIAVVLTGPPRLLRDRFATLPSRPDFKTHAPKLSARGGDEIVTISMIDERKLGLNGPYGFLSPQFLAQGVGFRPSLSLSAPS